MSRPTATDIRAAIESIEAGDAPIDPSRDPVSWACNLYDLDGRLVGDGNGDTPGEAMAIAWIAVWAPDALVADGEGLDDVPLSTLPSWRFELMPPLPHARLPFEIEMC